MILRPSREEFRELATGHTVVPVWTEVLADLETPVAAFAKLVGDGNGFLLESVEHGERWGRFSFVGWDPVLTMTLREGVVELDGPEHVDVPRDQGILAAIEAVLCAYNAPELPELPPLSGGLIGYLGYDVIREVERLPHVPPRDQRFPDAVMTMIGSLAAFDHWRQRVTLIESVPIHTDDEEALDAAYTAAAARLEAAVAALGRALPYRPVAPPSADDEISGGGQLDARRRLSAGGRGGQGAHRRRRHLPGRPRPALRLPARCRPVRRLSRPAPDQPEPVHVLRARPEVTVVGSSPEPMVKLVDHTIISRPIAGTRRRGRTDDHDRRLAAELVEHPKERAEHVMLVDLARNDVGRVARFGTVHVDELLTLERYSHVMHLTSQVSGTLVPGLGPIDVLRATLPAGTVSGAPKVRAMEIIDELEPVKRGPYAGVVGYVDWRGNLDTAIAIRTMFIDNGVASVQAGAGIVADSDPDDENLECRNKAAALLAAVPAARRMRQGDDA